MHRTLHFILSCAVAFTIPLHKKLVPPFIVLLLLNWIYARFKDKFTLFAKPLPMLLLVGFYVWHLVGMVWSENQGYGWFDMEVKLSFLAFPLIFATSHPLSASQVRRVLHAFAGGVTLAILLCLGHSTYMFFTDRALSYQFFGSYFAWIMHTGYLAMFINLAIGILIWEMVRSWSQWKMPRRLGQLALIAWFSFSVVQTSAKNGIITLLLLLVAAALYWTVSRKRWKLGIAGIVALIVGVIGVVKFSPRTLMRFEMAWEVMNRPTIDKTATEGTAIRTFAWDASLTIYQDNLLLGVGTGDVKDELLNQYETKGYTGALAKKVNAHSQYFQTAAALGTVGLTLLVVLFLVVIALALRRKAWVLLTVSGSVALYAFTESLFEVQRGVVFFTFFVALLLCNWHAKPAISSNH